MGLSVSLYYNIERSDDPENEDGFLATVVSERYKERIKNLEFEKYYKGDHYMGMVSYPYSRHYSFRVYLLEISGQLDYIKTTIIDGKEYKEIKWGDLKPEMSFYKLIDFSDCEGCFDWETSSEILKDFKKYEEISKQRSGNNPMDRTHYHYLDWIELLELSVELNGVVVFG